MDVYFEAMECHKIEQDARKEKFGVEFSEWKVANLERMVEIEKRYKYESLTQEDLTFIMNQASENLLMKWETGEEFFVHHFQRVKRQEDESRTIKIMADMIEIYRNALKEIAKTETPWFGQTAVSDIKRTADLAFHKTAQMYRWFEGKIR